MNNIYLRRKKKIIIQGKNNQLEDVYISTLLKNVENLGYTFSAEIIEILRTYSVDEIEEFYREIIGNLKQLLGDHVSFKPMYPNFPRQVMEAKESELYLNAWLHYFGDWLGIRILPQYLKEPRPTLKDNINLKIIELGNVQDFNLIFTRVVGSNIPVSEIDKVDIEWFVKHYQDSTIKYLPNDIPLKENIAFIGASLTKYTNIADSFMRENFKTATDILRYITVLSDGDVSLSENTKFKNIKKRDRRLILSLLENCTSITEDMLRYREQWKRIGEKIHPSEYKNKFPKCYEAFDVIRNDKPFETFNRKLEKFLSEKNLESLIALLKNRPGEFARKLDKLIRISKDANPIIETFEQIAGKVSNAVLLQVLTHFKYRNQTQDLRIFFPKGNVSKVQAIKYNLNQIDEVTRLKVVSICKDTLVQKFKNMEPLGNVYIDKSLEKYTVPFALRSSSKSLKTISKGSKLDLPDGNTVRFFIWWKDGKQRTDIDLSAIALDKNYIFKTTIAYFNLKELGGYHSGDITSAPDGASEFIDIDINQFLNFGSRYIIMSINSYTQQPFVDLPECFAGYMIRQHPNSGEIFDPKTVENKFDITSNTKICIPLIIDLEDRKVIWTDISITDRIGYNNNVINNLSSISLMSKAMTSLMKPSLYELFQLHAEARGKRTESKQEANTIFSEKEGITPLDVEQIIANFL
ncbi:cytoplasmic protein [Leptospira congkakensis]|uniref:Cytoplasmic protein n=1 Tax=Leptospira congkakensis TaxID=2484932 RepID=A0A4Z1A718_9LEPT|nr:TerD family protein [Leptospira congkakensis]TGL86709.1 cytoplasmic protein [Leptospira congkakensis]TGL93746.1 cytoplasmic protein [Leptospira congkakensis]TGL94848.1 cytoplasmic protein [Leptospira congkakensis]